MRVGLDSYSLTAAAGSESGADDVLSTLAKAKELGAEGIQTGLPDTSDGIQQVFQSSAELGMYFEPYIPLPVDWRGRQEVIERKNARFHLIAHAASEHGIRAVHCSVGERERFEDLGRWKEFVGTVVECLCRLAPELRELGLRVGIENHWDFTTYELIEIAERAGPDVVGMGLDTGNLLMYAEAPEKAAYRVAPYVATVHLKDAMLYSTPHGATRAVMPIGEGQVGVLDIIRILAEHNSRLNLTIEDHPGLFEVEYLEDWWLAAVPEITVGDLATAIRLTREGDRWLAEHRVPDPRTVELIPWGLRNSTRLTSDIATVKQAASSVSH